MKIVMWTNNQPNQKALAAKIHARFPIHTVVVESGGKKKKRNPQKTFSKIIERIFFPSLTKAWKEMLRHYSKKTPGFPDAEIIHTDQINSKEVFALMKQLEPDLIIVSGTSMIREPLLSLLPKIGIINLHTGLSPYVKGGPNCTNWCLATDQLHLIGNTVMWLDQGIDTGNIIVTEQTDLDGTETLAGLHITVMDHAHDLYLRAVQSLVEGKGNSVPQASIAAGTTYYTKNWSYPQVKMAISNFRNFRTNVRSDEFLSNKQSVKTIKLKS